MFPKFKISIYFMLYLLKFFSNFDIYQTNFYRCVLQIALVCLMWIFVLTLIKLIIKNKIGKKVFFYERESVQKNFLFRTLKNCKILNKLLKF